MADGYPVTGAGGIAAVVLLVFAASGLAALEAAYSRATRVTVEAAVREGRRGAMALQQIVAEPARYLNLLLLLRLGAELLATVLVARAFLGVLPTTAAVLVAAAVMTVVSYVLVGVAPRTLGRQRAPQVAVGAARPTVALTRVFGPLPRLLIVLGNALTPGKGFPEGPFATEAELRDLVNIAEETQLIERGEREMIHGVFELGDTLAREVMVPRTDIVFIEGNKTVRQALSLALRSGFSRIPVVGENEDDVVGVVYLKDLTRRVHFRGEEGERERVEDAMRPAAFVPDTKPVDALLREMQAQQIHMAICIDEYGGTAGLVTIEDILEEIVGEITDEYDRELPPVEEVDERTVRVTARFPIEDLNERYGVDLPAEDVETVGGLLASELGRVPIPGATVSLQGLTLRAESPRGRRNRVATVLVTQDEPSATRAEPEPADA